MPNNEFCSALSADEQLAMKEKAEEFEGRLEMFQEEESPDGIFRHRVMFAKRLTQDFIDYSMSLRTPSEQNCQLAIAQATNDSARAKNVFLPALNIVFKNDKLDKAALTYINNQGYRWPISERIELNIP